MFHSVGMTSSKKRKRKNIATPQLYRFPGKKIRVGHDCCSCSFLLAGYHDEKGHKGPLQSRNGGLVVNFHHGKRESPDSVEVFIGETRTGEMPSKAFLIAVCQRRSQFVSNLKDRFKQPSHGNTWELQHQNIMKYRLEA